MEDQGDHQSCQRPINLPIVVTEKSKTNYLLVVGIVFACLIVFGLGGYYLGRQSGSYQPINGLDQQGSMSADDPTIPGLKTRDDWMVMRLKEGQKIYNKIGILTMVGAMHLKPRGIPLLADHLDTETCLL